MTCPVRYSSDASQLANSRARAAAAALVPAGLSGGGVTTEDAYAHRSPDDVLRDARYGFESTSRFTATVPSADGPPLVFVLTRDGLTWRLTDIRLPLGAADAALPAGWALEASHPLRVPGLDAERHLVVIARTAG